jgi:hypothetical protein
MALGELRLSDWWRVPGREILSGLALGTILGVVGFMRIALWSAFSDIYGPHWVLVAMTVGLSLVGVVLWGTLSGSMLPLILRKLSADPATVLRTVRGHARRCYRPRDLLYRCSPRYAEQPVVAGHPRFCTVNRPQWRSGGLKWLGALLLFQGLLGLDLSLRLARPIVQNSMSQIPAACSTATSDFACSLSASK